MKLVPRGPHGQLLFRTYLILVGGLAATAALLDYGFGRLQAPAELEPNAWVESTLTLVEARLAAADADARDDLARALERELGLPVRLLPLDHVIREDDDAAGRTQEIFDDAGRASYFRESERLNAALHVGPLPDEHADAQWLDFVPPLFYLAIFVLVGLWLWPLIRDVDLLTHAAREFARDARRPTATHDKATILRDLAASFDEMSARIRGLIQAQKDLTSAISHEIRTPLARIKFALAVIASKAPIEEDLRAIEEDVREVDRLIGAMLDFARLDRPDVRARWQATAGDAWLERVAGKALLKEGQTLRHSAPDEPVPMDPDLMAVALSNLLVNASRYAKTTLAVELGTDGEGSWLAVEDDGPGIPEEARETVFKAFARLDDSRSRGTGGYGLGLAIVARVAALHGGRARAESSSLGGARIVLSWPHPPAAR